MKKWIFLSILSAITVSFWSLSLKQGLFTTFAPDFTFYFSLVSLIMIIIIKTVMGVSFQINSWGLLAGISIGISNIMFMRSNQLAANPGLPMAIMRCQIVYTFIASYFIFGGKLKFYKIVGILLSVIGVIIIIKFQSNEHFMNYEDKRYSNKLKNQVNKQLTINNHSNTKNKNLSTKNYSSPSTWISLSLLSGVFVSGKDILTRKGFDINNTNPINIIMSTMIVQTLVNLAYKLYKSGNIYLEDMNHDGKVDYKDYKYVIISGISYSIYNLLLLYATPIAPNIGYIKSIVSFGTVIIVILSRYLFQSAISIGSWIGIFINIIGIILVSI